MIMSIVRFGVWLWLSQLLVLGALMVHFFLIEDKR